jgi:type I restriction-modification system DNA methylase subunit
MSEELSQRGLEKEGIRILSYEFYNIGNTTLKQLKGAKVIADLDYGDYEKSKPDGLLVNRSGQIPNVIVVIENKDSSEFRTESQRKLATEQCNTLCQVLRAKIGVATDKNSFIWINPLETSSERAYKDHINGTLRSYSLILTEDKRPLSEPFIIGDKSIMKSEGLDEETRNTLSYIERIISDLNNHNSVLKASKEVDPLPLAKSVWQDIYVNTKRSPVKCLYNVVEIFIFKFLSDLNVLQQPNNFDFLMSLFSKTTEEKVLEYYAKNCRPEINRLFPKGADNTNIINGTIFVNEKGDAVRSQATLFHNTLRKYQEFGTLRHVRKEFKTKLFETFLKQSKEKAIWGQFFTPRKIVRAIVDMSGVESLTQGSRICDPFCGVGGFLLEAMQKPQRKGDFVPKGGEIIPKISYTGYDKGMDTDEERIIILAKANMLVYLSDVLERFPTLTKEFAKVFNETFHFLTDSNLGTLERVGNEEEKYDLILTNPPYITSGIKSLKAELQSKGLSRYYRRGKGMEALALQWIIMHLHEGGKAFVIIPESILSVDSNIELKRLIRQTCNILCLISLPIRAFFNTPQKTYILGLERQPSNSSWELHQTTPVFTYLASNIGETLDVNRFETEGESDLEKARNLFNLFKGSPMNFPVNEIGDKRCKLQPISKFIPEDPWDIDRWWSLEEKIELKIEKKKETVSINEFASKLSEFADELKSYANELKDIED